MISVLTRCYSELSVSEVNFIRYLKLFADISAALQPGAGVQAEPQVNHSSFGAAVPANAEAAHPEIGGSIIRALSLLSVGFLGAVGWSFCGVFCLGHTVAMEISFSCRAPGVGALGNHTCLSPSMEG